jgi:hypothetical protein
MELNPEEDPERDRATPFISDLVVAKIQMSK